MRCWIVDLNSVEHEVEWEPDRPFEDALFSIASRIEMHGCEFMMTSPLIKEIKLHHTLNQVLSPSKETVMVVIELCQA